MTKSFSASVIANINSIALWLFIRLKLIHLYINQQRMHNTFNTSIRNNEKGDVFPEEAAAERVTDLTKMNVSLLFIRSFSPLASLPLFVCILLCCTGFVVNVYLFLDGAC